MRARPVATPLASGDFGTIHKNCKGTTKPEQTIPIVALESGWDSSGGRDMTHPLLLNPFHARQEPAQQAERRSPPPTRSTPVCSHCHSDDITSHATAQWSNEKQEWQLANTFARPTHCNSCNAPCEITWLPLN